MTKYLDYEGLKAFKKEADKTYVRNQKGVITSELYANQSIWGEHVLNGTLFGYHFHPASISSRQLMNKCVTTAHLDNSVYEYMSQKVINGAWVPVKAGHNSEGNIIEGAVSEGKETITNAEYAHAEGLRTVATGMYSHAEGIYNYDSNDFIKVLGVGSSDDNRVNAEVVYVKRGENGVPISSDPKNGCKYILGIGGYTGKAITEGMKSIQEVISDLLSRIAILEAKVKS